MSINYKKMADLIEQEVNKMADLSSSQKERLAKLSNKIYTSESSVDATSTQKMVEEMMKKISSAASDFSGQGISK
jgi:DNA-directed RNA polymerase sigma subunit (sigma70/sigma32)